MKFLAFIAGLFFILSSHFAAGMPSQASPVQSFETALQSQSSLDYVAMSKGMTENSGASFWKSRIFRRILIVMSVAVLSMLLIILCVIVLFKVMPGFQYTVTAFLESVFRKKTLHDALQKNDMKELRWLIKKGEDVNLKDGWKGFTPLHLAVDENKEEMVKVLISEGAHIDAPDSMGKTPIFYAHTIEMAELLISQGADINAKNKKGDTVLLSALSSRVKEIPEYLLTRGAEVNVRNSQGNTPLHLAAKSPCLGKLIEALVEKGAELNARNSEGRTPLHTAVQCMMEDAVNILLLQGAESTLKDREGATPLQLAENSDDTAIINLLRSHNASS